MATISFETYPDMMKDYEKHIENDNYDNELRIFTVPKIWALRWIKHHFEHVKYFKAVYDWDDTYQMYSDAHAAGVLIEEHVEPRYV